MSKLVFVTGASGFLASHIIYQLIEQGHRVRATARANKVNALRELYSGRPVEIVEVADVARTQFEEALKGVDVVIHTASPLPGREDIEALLKTAIEGSLNVLRQAEKVGVKKIVVTSSTVSVIRDPTAENFWTLRAEHWNPVTKEDAASGESWTVYAASKKFAELAVWEWAEQHPHVDVTVINPCMIFGPFAPLSLPIAPGDYTPFSTNLSVYNFLFLTGKHSPEVPYIDVRDVGRAHVLAALAPADKKLGRKRIVFASPYGSNFAEVKADILRERPELEGRFITAPPPEWGYDRYVVDFGRIEEVLGMKKGDFHTRKETYGDTVEAVLEVEKKWKEAGYEFPKTIPAW